MQNEGQRKRRSILHSPSVLFLRGFVPLLLVAVVLLLGPTLAVWWAHGGTFRLGDAVIGGAVSLMLLLAAGLAFGWLVGRLGRGRK